MKKLMAVLLMGFLGFAVKAQPTKDGRLKVFFVDVEGGQATLFVTPAGESLLIDTGWPGNDSRDAKRIVGIAKGAGLSRIDYVLLTHYHDDHVGGVPQLVALMPVGTFVDHGTNRETDVAVTAHGFAEYQKVLASGKSKHLVVKPGDHLPIHGMDVEVLSGDGEVLAAPLAGAGEKNSFCDASEVRPVDTTENGRSLGVVVMFGGLKILDLGDLTWDRERSLMCPVDRIGKVDVLIVSHHGFFQSSSPALVDAIHARVAIMDNGAKKGGSPATLKTLHAAPGLETLWQLHSSEEAGTAANTAEQYIANPTGIDAANYLELDALTNGEFMVKNSRTGITKNYPSVGH